VPKKREYRQLLVRNIGVFWRRDQVFWGSPGKSGHLYGVPQDRMSAEPTDFWEQTGVYALYANYNIVYVGQTGKRGLGKRLYDHVWDHLSGRWNQFSWFGVRYAHTTSDELSEPPTLRVLSLQTVLNHLEGVLIEVAEPPMNGQKGRFGTQVIRFEQIPATNPSEASLESVRSQLLNLDDKVEHVEAAVSRKRAP
jgi:hypothetical protein